MDLTEMQDRLMTIDQRGLKPAEAVSECMSVYLEAGAAIAELEAVRTWAKQVIGDVFAEIGADRLETTAGQCYVSKPSIRVSYDTKGLDKLAQERPDLGAVLALYRSEKEIAGSLVIRTAKSE